MLDGKKQTFDKMRMRKITEQQMFLFFNIRKNNRLFVEVYVYMFARKVLLDESFGFGGFLCFSSCFPQFSSTLQTLKHFKHRHTHIRFVIIKYSCTQPARQTHTLSA